MDQTWLQADFAVKLTNAAKKLFSFCPVGKNDGAGTGEIILCTFGWLHRDFATDSLIINARQSGFIAIAQREGRLREQLQVLFFFWGFNQ